MPKKVDVYAPVDGVELVALHQVIDGEDNVMDVPEEAVEVWAESGWKKASQKVAKAAESEEE